MNKFGWLFMSISWTVILSLLVFCLYNVFFKDNKSGDKK